MVKYTESALNTLYDHLILSDCVCMGYELNDKVKISNLKKYEVKHLVHALETCIINKKDDIILDRIRTELGIRNGVKN